jgi:peroxiredoxin
MELCVCLIVEDVYCEIIWQVDKQINENVIMLVDLNTKYGWKKNVDLVNYFN